MKTSLVLAILCLPLLLANYSSGGPIFGNDAEGSGSVQPVFQRSAMTGELIVENMERYPAVSPDLQQGTRQEEYLCLWSGFSVIPDPNSQSCEVHLETIDWLCSPVAGELTTATAVYPANAGHPGDYIPASVGDVNWGYLPGLPEGWCWILMVDFTWSGIPFMPNPHLLDRASAYNHGLSVPPMLGYCGWPLSEPPAPFLFHCP